MECPCYPTFGNNLAADLALVNCENGNSFDLRNIGHGGMCGKESRVHNDFGLDYKNLKDAGYAADEIWPILCEMDSDNDNRTNGEELGDPNCAWRKCETGTCTKTTAVSHPGYEEVYDNTTSEYYISEDHPDYNFICENLIIASLQTFLFRVATSLHRLLISQLIRYARASTKYTDFVLRARLGLTSSLRKFYGRYGELVIHYDVPLSRMVDDILS
ncbi:hypothetical protein FSP39_008185 [Pinctada imbricata]|uniref:Temptin Cys/Cys disulfide domain-containing protein n=1 Tax=Pinctada imbricata TaxID=66713 RepID=A0AA89C0V4_PINIB|nr:hypothetical protein FSP39_008185 [Pinctada imbricata]